MIVIVPAEALEEAKRHAKLLSFEENFDALHSDGEKSQILSICTQPYHYPVRKSWLFLSGRAKFIFLLF